ncbi:ABC transporter ATP-binding protein [Martelella sp. AMO21009]
MAQVELQNVRKSYGNLTVIPDLDLTIPSGEFVCLVGPSGSGKSTLLRMIAGLEDITGGTIRVDGEDITNTDPSDRDMAMVFQTYALYPHMTVEQNMSFALRMRGEDRALIDRRVGEAVSMLGLQGLEKRKPGQLSGGQRQRVAMGRCIVRNPKLFLFDEPLSNLDAKLRAQTRLEIRRLHGKLGATSIFVTHDQVEAMTMADRIALLDHGRIQQVGSPKDLYLNPANRFVAGFLGTPEMSIFRGTVSVVDGKVAFDGPQAMTLPASPERIALLAERIGAGQTVDLGIRPEHFQIVPAGGDTGSKIVVDVIEWLGHEIFVFGELGGTGIAVRAAEGDAGGQRLPQQGETIAILPARDAWHLFDAEDGRNLLN